jgi:DNA-directed RNA polymerase specialized sigma24 family protein
LARLVFAEERSTAEVAEVLSIPPGTVKSRVFTLRRRLRAALLGAGTGDREEGS